MAKIRLQPEASSTNVFTIATPAGSSNRTLTLPDSTGTLLTADGDGSSLTGISSVGGATGVDFNDDVKIRVGTGNDLEIYHDGSHSYIKDVGTGNLYIDGANNIILRDDSANWFMRCEKSAQVSLNYNGTKKFETTDTGIAVTGGVAIGGTAAANTLDSYEEGEWNPVGKFGGSAGPTGSFTGTYVKIGKQVIAAFNLAVSSLGSNTGAFTLTGLPFAPTHGNRHSTGWGYLHRIAGSTHEEMFCYLASGLIGFQEKGVNGNNSSGFTNSSFTASTHIAGSVTYETNS